MTPNIHFRRSGRRCAVVIAVLGIGIAIAGSGCGGSWKEQWFTPVHTWPPAHSHSGSENRRDLAIRLHKRGYTFRGRTSKKFRKNLFKIAQESRLFGKVEKMPARGGILAPGVAELQIGLKARMPIGNVILSLPLFVFSIGTLPIHLRERIDMQATLLSDGKVLERFNYRADVHSLGWGPVGWIVMLFKDIQLRGEVARDITRRLLVDVGDRLYGKDKMPE